MRYDREVAVAIARWAPAYGVTIDSSVVHGILEQETRHGLLPAYVQSGGAVREPDGDFSYGPMQVKGSTAKTELGVTNLDTLKFPAGGISAGVHYLAILLARAKGDVSRAVTSYNGAGPAARAYAVKVLAFARKYAGLAIPVVVLAAALLFLLPRLRASATR